MLPFPTIAQRLIKPSPTTFCVMRVGFPPIASKPSKYFMGTAIYTNPRNPSRGSAILDLLRNQRVDQAHGILTKTPNRDIRFLTMMITAYSRNQRLDYALQLFFEMPERDAICWNMIKGCLDCGDLGMARKLFDEMPNRNVVSWTTIMNGFLQHGDIKKAEEFFCEMPSKDVATWNAMIHGYFSHDRVKDALGLFKEMPSRNDVSWTSMISGLEQHGKNDGALYYFRHMVGSCSNPTSSTISCVLTACANLSALYQGVQIHAYIVKLGYLFDAFVSSSLVTFYAKCKQIENACMFCYEQLHLNVAVWTALLTGYGLNEKHGDALNVFVNMIKMGILPNELSFVSALNSCCASEALDMGKEIHAASIKLGFEKNAFVGNSLIVMYSKCGHIKDGTTVFENIREKNTVSWNSIIVSCAQHGLGRWALIFFSRMLRDRIEPDEITFTGLLSACGRSGMLEKGRSLFKYISQHRSIEVKLEHYACMVDILGRNGKLEEAEDLIKKMPMKANAMVWLALLSACRVHFNLEMAERAANCIFYLDPYCSPAFVLLSNLYASIGRWSDVARIRERMKQQGFVKQPGHSWVALRGSNHVFLSGDRSHPLSDGIYQKLDSLGGKLKEFGYVPDRRFALHDVEDEQQEEILCYHSERLAIGFALIATADGSAITVMKNLRVCGDCHSAIKIIAKILGREIVVRDSSRFHHFKNGSCSCGDYW